MASVRQVGKTWEVRHRTPDGESRRRRGFATKREAQAYLTEHEHAKHRGDYVDPAGRRTFGDYAADWQAVQVHRSSTAEQVETHLRRHVLPTFGHRPLASVRPSEVQAWVKGRTAVLAPATVEVVFRYVAAIFAAAVGDNLLGRNPCAGVRLPKVPPCQVVPPTVEAVEALADAVPARYRALVVLAAGTGLRQGECFGLTVDRVDFLRRQLRVDRQLVLARGGPPVFGPPKTEAFYRTVPLPQAVVDALAAHLASYPAGADGLVFTNERGEGIRRNRFSEVWRPVAAGAHFHELRHFYASLLIRHGESVKVVQARLGHASATETLDTYGHLWPDSEDRTREAVDLVLGAFVSAACHTGAGEA